MSYMVVIDELYNPGAGTTLHAGASCAAGGTPRGEDRGGGVPELAS